MKLPYAILCRKAIIWIYEEVGDDDIVQHYLNILEQNKFELRALDDKIIQKSKQNKQTKLLMTVPGIAEIRALELIAEIGEIERFESLGKLSSYAGLVPSIRQSGDSLKFGRLIKQPSRILKNALIEVCWNLVRTKETNSLQEFYKKLAKKKGKQKAICATARKLCCVIYSMLKHQEEFRYS